jgi:phage terminase large subunit-like protein
MPPLLAPRPPAIAWSESFDLLDLSRWRETELHGRTAYQAVTLDGRTCLKSDSRAAASILVTEVRVNPDTYEWLSWDWRVDQLVTGEALEQREGSDVAARVYVYFKSKGLPWQKRNLDYVWSAKQPVGTILTSAYSATSKIIVVESGAEALGQWRHVERNLEDDYRLAFGEDPPHVLAIGLMTDTDNTGGQAVAYFDELRISRRREAP